MKKNNYILNYNINKSLNEKVKYTFKEKMLVLSFDFNNIYGLGQRYNSINHKGQVYKNMVQEEFCHQGDKTYFPLPFFHTDTDLGFFLNTNEIFTIEFNDDIEITFEQDIDEIDLTIYEGSNKEIISMFIEDTGEINLAPSWIYGLWVSCHRWNSTEDVLHGLEEYKTNDIPFSTVVLEQWSDEATFYMFNNAKRTDRKTMEYREPFLDPRSMIKSINDMDAKVLLWQAPVFKDLQCEPDNELHFSDLDYLLENNLVVKGENEPYRIPEGNWFPRSYVPDFTNPLTNEWYFGNREYLLDLGVEGFKTDGGEFIHTDKVKTHDNLRGSEKTNTYITDYLKGYKDFIGDDKVLFSRAGYIGQQSYSLQWVGDQESVWSELPSIYNSLISLSLSGQSNIGFDIGGFSGELPTPELYRRSVQLAAFVPIMQIHSEPIYGQFEKVRKNDGSVNDRTPWNIGEYYKDESLVEDTRPYFQLRDKLKHYYKSHSINATKTNTTLIRHMMIDYEGFEDVNDQYMFCDFLVVPALHKDTEVLEVKLPEGNWYQFEDNKKVVGDQTLLREINENEIPVYIKSETCIPMVENNKLTLYLYGEKGTAILNESINHCIEISWKNNELTISPESIFDYESYNVVFIY